jgi:hypothetical protein
MYIVLSGGDYMPDLAPWEIEENERWKHDGTETPDVVAEPPVTRSATFQTEMNTAPFQPREPRVTDKDIDINIDPQTARELRHIGAFDGYVKYHRQVLAVCGQMREHLKKLNAALFKDCELESLPERYEDISRELEENWGKRKQSEEAVKKGIFLATGLIKAFPVYRFFVPLAAPLRLIGCMGDRLDASQVSLVLDNINRLPGMPYSEPSFLGMRCVACDRLLSLYLRTKEYEKALDVCDCGITIESAGPGAKDRFRHRKRAVAKMIQKRSEMKNAWSFSYERQLKKRSVSHHDLSNAGLR